MMTDMDRRIRSLCDEVDLARSIAADLRKECAALQAERDEARATLRDLMAALYSQPLDPPQVSADLDYSWRNQIAYAKDTALRARGIDDVMIEASRKPQTVAWHVVRLRSIPRIQGEHR